MADVPPPYDAPEDPGIDAEDEAIQRILDDNMMAALASVPAFLEDISRDCQISATFARDILPNLRGQNGLFENLQRVENHLDLLARGELVQTASQKITQILDQNQNLTEQNTTALEQQRKILEVLSNNQVLPIIKRQNEDVAEQHRQAVEQREDILNTLRRDDEEKSGELDVLSLEAIERQNSDIIEQNRQALEQRGNILEALRVGQQVVLPNQEGIPAGSDLEVLKVQNAEIIEQNRQKLEQGDQLLDALQSHRMSPSVPQIPTEHSPPSLEAIEQQNNDIIEQNRQAFEQRTKVLQILQDFHAVEPRPCIIPHWGSVVFWILVIALLVIIVIQCASTNTTLRVEWEAIYKGITAQLASSKPDWMSLVENRED